MSLARLKQNAEILVEVAENYEKILEKKKAASKQDILKYENYEKNFRDQFLYLLAAIHKITEEKKNAR